MERISIHSISKMSIDEVIDRFHENTNEFDVEFDDAILKTNGCEIVLNRFVLEYHRHLPTSIPILARYSFSHKREMTPHTPLDLCTLIYRDYIDMYEGTELDIDDHYMNKIVYKKVVNGIYNFVVEFLDAYVQGADSLEFIELLMHPPIREANDYIKSLSYEPTPEQISHVYDVIKKETLTSPDLKHNSWAIALRCKAIKMVQMQMMIGPIGYCTDINSSLFPRPIRTSFYEGSAKLWEFAIESRNAAIASLYNELIMPIAQYSNRRYQLICQPMRWVVRADCGSRHYKSTLIEDARKLKVMEGLWRLDETTGNLSPIKTTDTFLIGTTIKHRSTLYCEWNASRSEICSVCHGRIYRSAMMFSAFSNTNIKGNNIGHIAATAIGEKNSSLVLSRKHSNSTSVAAKHVLSIEASTYLKVSDDGRFLLIHNKFKPINQLKILLFKEQVDKLHDIKDGVIDITSPSTTTAIERIEIIDGTLEEGFNKLSVVVGSKQRTGFLSADALDYIRTHGWEYDNKRNIIVSLDHWDMKTPFLTVPQIEFSPPEFIENVTSIMLGPSKDEKDSGISRKRLDSYVHPPAALDAFYDEIKDHLLVHYSHLSIIMLALSAQDPANDDYRLPYPRHKGIIVTEAPLVLNNSVGMSMAYEDQHKILSSPSSYVLHRRRGHPLDTLLLSGVYGNRKKVLPPLSGGYE